MDTYERARQVDDILTKLQELEATDTHAMSWEERHAWSVQGVALQKKLHSLKEQAPDCDSMDAPRLKAALESYFYYQPGNVSCRRVCLRLICDMITGNLATANRMENILAGGVCSTHILNLLPDDKADNTKYNASLRRSMLYHVVYQGLVHGSVPVENSKVEAVLRVIDEVSDHHP